MAGQVTLNCNKDSRIADNGTSLGAGASDCNPIGLYSSYLYRTLLGFPVSFAGMTSITSAYLKVKTSNQLYIGFGSDPDFKVRRLLGSFSEGSASSMSSTNAVEWSNQPSAGASYVFCTPSEAENTWGTYNVTGLIQEAFAAGVFYGFRLEGNNEASANDTTEIWSRESGNGTPQLIINYETNVGPNPPVNLGATGGLNPTLTFDHSDNDGDALGSYDLQVSTDASFGSVTHLNAVASNAGVAGNHVSYAYAGAALSRGVTYYWRVATRSATGVVGPSGWTTGGSWYVNQLPTLTLQSPAPGYVACEMTYAAGWGSPYAVIRWAFSDPDGGAQAAYQVVVMQEGGAVIRDTGYVAGAASSYVVPDVLVRGTNYRVTVAVWDSAGESVIANYVQFKPQWAVAEYRIDLGGTVTAWSTVANSTGGANKMVVTEYASSPSGGAIGAWYGSLASAALGRWFHFRVWLFAWAGATSPSFDKLGLTYTSSVGVPPDGWTVDSKFALDTGTKVYGTQSLRATCDGGVHVASQVIPVQKNTDYILSGRVKSDGNSGAQIQIVNAAGTVVVGQSPVISTTQEFTRIQTPVWNSGDSETCRIHVAVVGPAPNKAWFDALKLENSRVVTAWTPGFVGAGVSIDAGGIKVDATPAGGATLRLQGASGGARDTVELGSHGLVFAGDGYAELYSPENALLYTPGHIRAAGYIQSYGPMYPASVYAGGPVVAPYNLSAGSAAGVMRIGGTGTSAANWVKLASGTISGQYWQQQLHGYVVTRYGISEISYVVHADAGTSAQPSVTGNIRILTETAGQAIYTARIVVKTLNPITYELWVQVVGGYSFISWYPDIIEGEGAYPVIENPNSYGWASNPPAGVAYALIQHTGIRMQKGSTARNITVANGTAQGIVTFPVPFQNTPFVWAYANASAGNAAYVTIQSVSTTQFDLGLKAATVWNYGVEWMAWSQ